jgi:hypothetical protein
VAGATKGLMIYMKINKIVLLKVRDKINKIVLGTFVKSA